MAVPEQEQEQEQQEGCMREKQGLELELELEDYMRAWQGSALVQLEEVQALVGCKMEQGQGQGPVLGQKARQVP